jgi:hypothetical protein
MGFANYFCLFSKEVCENKALGRRSCFFLSLLFLQHVPDAKILKNPIKLGIFSSNKKQRA